MRSISISPSPNLLDVLANSGYSLETALADLLDNSIAANAKYIEIDFEYAGLESMIRIVDNGDGMDESSLILALQYAPRPVSSERRMDDLGRFGVGLKAATSSFCKYVRIITKSASKKPIVGAIVDFDQMKENQSWDVALLDQCDIDFPQNKASGTVIECRNLHFDKDDTSNQLLLESRDSFFRHSQKVEEHISRTFHKFLEHDLNILVNGNHVRPWDPFLRRNPSTRTLINDPMHIKIGEKSIGVEAYVLPAFETLGKSDREEFLGRDSSAKLSMVDLQGFYIYRNERLINMGGWLDLEGFKKESKYAYARIGINIDNTMDDLFAVNFLKNRVQIPNSLIRDFTRLAKATRIESRKNHDYVKDPRPNRHKRKSHANVWNVSHANEKLIISINEEHPYISELTKEMDNVSRKRLFDLLSKELPVGRLQNFEFEPSEYTDMQIMDMISSLYDNARHHGLSHDEAISRIALIEPLNNPKYEIFLEQFKGKCNG